MAIRKKTVSSCISKQDAAALAKAAAEADTTVSDLIRGWINRYLGKEPKDE